MYPFNFKGYFKGTLCYEYLNVFNLYLSDMLLCSLSIAQMMKDVEKQHNTASCPA
jgi:hypothetical protein